ncbi:MAG TPA: tetratricopeptide repeat protein [Paraburkholderia sp.]|uniref:tetratricopeptide repeat protein n=1 Tax=Paraburkholderia sp. TaxID=1926495 RepID=UPI002B464C89|nr:tetratricopeptide repeat protein [Paraburkholderia sp.]HKR47348.1 tetratricopeptide repeat protein [Paraburkholderia sp.]
MINRVISRLSGVVLACGVIAGCATQDHNLAASPDAFNKALADADTAAKGGDQDRAIALYQKLAAADPTREEPWSRIAQIQFQQQHYGQAIVAAQEALQRDQTDRAAKSVLAVAGLRVATQSLGELRQDASLQGDAKSDAQALAKQLRDTLGEDSLFPPEQAEKAAPKKRRIVRHVQKPAAKPVETAEAAPAAPAAPATPAAAAPAPAKAAPAKAAASGGASDPFSALR